MPKFNPGDLVIATSPYDSTQYFGKITRRIDGKIDVDSAYWVRVDDPGSPGNCIWDEEYLQHAIGIKDAWKGLING